MKIFLTVIFALTLFNLLGNPCPVMASGVDGVIGTVTPPSPIASIAGNTGEEKLGTVLSSIITVIFAVTSVVFVFMIVLGAFQWTISGGDKEAIANARKRIVHAIIGITLLALSFVIVTIIGMLTGFELYRGQSSALNNYQKVKQELQVTGGKGFEGFEKEEKDKEKRRGGN